MHINCLAQNLAEIAGGDGGMNDKRNNQNYLSAYHLKLFIWIISLFYSQQCYKGGILFLPSCR